MEFVLNSEPMQTDLPSSTIVLDYLRSVVGLRGTKEGCREGDCGACTVLLGRLVDGNVVYRTRVSCMLMLGHLEGGHLVTIEGLSQANLTVIQRALIDAGATQCGFCTPGIVMALTGFALGWVPGRTFEDALRSLDGNLCRCTGYQSIARAARTIFDRFDRAHGLTLAELVELDVLPDYFVGIPGLLGNMAGPRKQGCADEARNSPLVVAGGTDFVLRQRGDGADSRLRFLTETNPGHIEEDDRGLRIGATVTFDDLENSRVVREYLPGIRSAMARIASTPIRNAATVGGNIVNGSPSADISVLLLSLDAVLCFGDEEDDHVMPLGDFFTGYKQNVLGDGQWVKWVRIPGSMRELQKNFEKVSKRTHLDIATVNTGCAIRLEGDTVSEFIVSAGGVAPYPLLLRETGRFLQGKALSNENILEAARLAETEIVPIDDIRGSASYKKRLLGQLICAHFHALFEMYPLEPEYVQ